MKIKAAKNKTKQNKRKLYQNVQCDEYIMTTLYRERTHTKTSVFTVANKKEFITFEPVWTSEIMIEMCFDSK